MGLFGQSTPFDADVEKATSETNTADDWSLIMDVCDKVTSNPRRAKDCLKAIMKRMGHSDPHVVMQAITLLDACVNNCGRPFHLEIASRDFENEFRRLLDKAQPQVSLKMRQVLKSWVEGDFKKDRELNLIPALFLKLKMDGHEFSNLGEKPKSSAAKLAAAAAKDPNVVSSQQEEDDIAKAIELSLKETKSSPKHAAASSSTNATAYPSLYPSFGGSGSLGSVNSNGNASSNSQVTEARKVRALYDFEAAEENELTFFAGEIIHVLDDTDPNWWKGFNQRGEGLFPSNFVTADLSVDPERLDINQKLNKNNSQLDEDGQTKTENSAAASQEPVQIDEGKIDRLLHLLHEANPEDPSQDSDEMLRLEQEVHQMGPLIDNELERVDRKHAQLTQLSSDLVDAINLYHSLMANDRAALANSVPGFMSGLPSGLNNPPSNPNFPSSSGTGAGNSMLYVSNSSYSLSFPPPLSQVPPVSFGPMNSLPYMPPTTVPPGLNSMNVASAPPQVPNYPNHPQMNVPMQYRNGNGFPPQVATTMGGPNQQQPQNLTNVSNGQMTNGGQPPQPHLHPQQQQQPPQQQQQHPQPNNFMGMPSADPQQKQAYVNNLPQQNQQIPQQIVPPPQFMSPQHQHQQQPQTGPPPQPQQQQQTNQASYIPQMQQALPQQYATLPNGPQPYMVPPATVAQGPQMNNYSQEQFSQLQQHLASMASMPQHHQQLQNPQNSVPQTMSNIPIYQQQP